MLVVDASVLAPAIVDAGTDGSTLRARLRGEQLAGPDLLRIEVLAVIRKSLIAGSLTTTQAAAAVDDLLDIRCRSSRRPRCSAEHGPCGTTPRPTTPATSPSPKPSTAPSSPLTRASRTLPVQPAPSSSPDHRARRSRMAPISLEQPLRASNEVRVPPHAFNVGQKLLETLVHAADRVRRRRRVRSKNRAGPRSIPRSSRVRPCTGMSAGIRTTPRPAETSSQGVRAAGTTALTR